MASVINSLNKIYEAMGGGSTDGVDTVIESLDKIAEVAGSGGGSGGDVAICNVQLSPSSSSEIESASLDDASYQTLSDLLSLDPHSSRLKSARVDVVVQPQTDGKMPSPFDEAIFSLSFIEAQVSEEDNPIITFGAYSPTIGDHVLFSVSASNGMYLSMGFNYGSIDIPWPSTEGSGE